MATQHAERRKHKRHDLSCPIRLFSQAGEQIAAGKTLNISDGGALVPVPGHILPRLRESVNLTVSVPRSTANTYMLEDFACCATVLRHEVVAADDQAYLAMEFVRPLHLAIEV